MPKILLIHGYGSGANYSFFKKHPADLEFSGFKTQLKRNEAVLFSWFQEENFTFLQTINPFSHINLYLKEKFVVQNAETRKNLHKVLEEIQPKVIVCHSLGSVLLKNFLEQNSLPNSVQNIYLIEADIPHDTKFKTIVQITNIYCFWDPSLWCSALINRYLPAGLFGLKSATKNIFFPLLTHLNLHLASIKSESLAQKITEQKI